MMSRDKQNIKTTDWLTRGIPKEQLEREKREAIREAEAELHNKQIEEMAKDLRTLDTLQYNPNYTVNYQRAVGLHSLGYRKSTDVAEEIFAEIEFEIHQLDFDREETRAIAIEGIIAKLKKKYTEEGK